MSRPIVIAHHLIWTAYGWWLPNDPRGSGSQVIRRDVLAELGELHRGRKQIQPVSGEIRTFYDSAAPKLTHPLREFSAAEIDTIADAFADAIANYRYTCYACAILPDHVHILIRKHKNKAEDMIANLQAISRSRLREGFAHFAGHPVWGGGGWKVFQDHPDDVRRTIGYINDNPTKHRLPPQRWPFVKEYDGWPLHPGHSPNSPYVKRLRGRT
jgi:REP element-mobilizing transposase RayT